jgi:hypothetical protein
VLSAAAGIWASMVCAAVIVGLWSLAWLVRRNGAAAED